MPETMRGRTWRFGRGSEPTHTRNNHPRFQPSYTQKWFVHGNMGDPSTTGHQVKEVEHNGCSDNSGVANFNHTFR
jgi:hypothetical protein